MLPSNIISKSKRQKHMFCKKFFDKLIQYLNQKDIQIVLIYLVITNKNPYVNWLKKQF